MRIYFCKLPLLAQCRRVFAAHNKWAILNFTTARMRCTWGRLSRILMVNSSDQNKCHWRGQEADGAMWTRARACHLITQTFCSTKQLCKNQSRTQSSINDGFVLHDFHDLWSSNFSGLYWNYNLNIMSYWVYFLTRLTPMDVSLWYMSRQGSLSLAAWLLSVKSDKTSRNSPSKTKQRMFYLQHYRTLSHRCRCSANSRY